jgi:hypothetical protein
VKAPTAEKSVADPKKGPLSEVCIVFPLHITLSGMTLIWGSMGRHRSQPQPRYSPVKSIDWRDFSLHETFFDPRMAISVAAFIAARNPLQMGP